MIVLGLLLILFAVGATAVAVTAPAPTAQVIEMTALGFKVSASPLAMFLAGAISTVLLALGFALISRGIRRRARKHKELKQLRQDHAVAATRSTADNTADNTDKGRHIGAETPAERQPDAEPHPDEPHSEPHS